MSRRKLDKLDRDILAWLSRDARTSNRQVAQSLGVTEGTVRLRIKRMEQDKLIRITAVTNIERFRGYALAHIWVSVECSDQAESVAQALGKMAEFGFVGLMSGRGDVLAVAMVRDFEHLSELIHQRIRAIPGVASTRTNMGVNFLKRDYRMARIVD